MHPLRVSRRSTLTPYLCAVCFRWHDQQLGEAQGSRQMYVQYARQQTHLLKPVGLSQRLLQGLFLAAPHRVQRRMPGAHHPGLLGGDPAKPQLSSDVSISACLYRYACRCAEKALEARVLSTRLGSGTNLQFHGQQHLQQQLAQQVQLGAAHCSAGWLAAQHECRALWRTARSHKCQSGGHTYQRELYIAPGFFEGSVKESGLDWWHSKPCMGTTTRPFCLT